MHKRVRLSPCTRVGLPARSSAGLTGLTGLILSAWMLAACAPISPTSTSSNTSTTPARSNSSLSSAAATRIVTDPQLSALLAYQERVYRVAAPLMIKNAVLCKTSARLLLGFTAKNKHSYPAELSRAVENSLKLDERLQVMQVLEGSGAMHAGVRRGDILVSIQGQPLPQGAQAEPETARMLAPLMKNISEIDVVVMRNGQSMKLSVPLTLGCAFALDIGNAPHVNAYADDKRIMLTRGMLDFLSSDAELAAVLAHEMAHNVQHHARSMQMSATLSGVIDDLLPLKPELSAFQGSAGIRPMDEKFDQEADRIALFMLVRAGMDPAIALTTFRKLALYYQASVANRLTASHPWTEQRASFMLATLSEIRQKQATKKALVP